MVAQGFLYSVNFSTLDGVFWGSLECSDTDSIMSLAMRLQTMEGTVSKLPEIVWNGQLLPYSCKVMELEGFEIEASEFQIVWPLGTLHAPMPAAIQRRFGSDIEAALAEVEVPECELNLAGIEGRASSILSISSRLPSCLLTLDIRKCFLDSDTVAALFEAMPAGVQVLRASHNAIPACALETLASTCCRPRALDVGWSDLEDGSGEFELKHLEPFFTDHVEEFGMGGISANTSTAISRLARCCPRLRKLDISGGGTGWHDEEKAAEAWLALASNCSTLEELLADGIDLLKSSLSALVAGCPSLKAMSIDVGADAGLCSLARSPLALDYLDIKVETADDLRIVSQLRNVQWLVIRTYTNDTGQMSCFDKHDIDKTLADIAAPDIDLRLKSYTEASLRNIGSRLRGVAACDCETPLLPILASVSSCCPNLLSFQVDYVEQISSKDLRVVAANCPLLEKVSLNGDAWNFQLEPIDDGILALGEYCHELRNLFLSDRYVEDPVRTLAIASNGWPRLQYLCLFGLYPPNGGVDELRDDWATVPGNTDLPKALALNCPQLEHIGLPPDALDRFSSFWHRGDEHRRDCRGTQDTAYQCVIC
eukprot:TRINITY_DN189_c0_g2_i1.p1 TRINITY_DN189_c0_g2~~TRINITY_DN189_c0_g2_i1.p1  ORF type:complete len:616 (+),score=53.79 TRINITY_DN189_c0_g2_i1:65-1849(+)